MNNDDPRKQMLERLAILYCCATPAPWKCYKNGIHPCDVGAAGSGDDYAILTHGPRGYMNANWISAIHNEWPMIVELLRELADDESLAGVPAGLDTYLDQLRRQKDDPQF